MLQHNSTLKSKIDQLWDKFRSGRIANLEAFCCWYQAGLLEKKSGAGL